MNKRPIAVTIIAILLILVGAGGLVRDAMGLKPHAAFHAETPLIAAVHLLAIVAGAFLLRGHTWARWLAVAWMAFHVAISYGHPLTPFLMHSAFLAIFGYFLFRADARAYFRTAEPGPQPPTLPPRQ
jgi:uncharacterized membrane protein